jgi:sporulation protein YlmC with PRC-barrel domain
MLLSQMIDRDVLDCAGRAVGTLEDLTADLGKQESPILVGGLLVRRHRASHLLMPWVTVQNVWHKEAKGVRRRIVLKHKGEELSAFEVRSISDALRATEILLKRDVLDSQVFDGRGQRLARVADVVLARIPGNMLELVGVDVSAAGVVRRLGLSMLAGRAREDVVAFSDVHLTSQRGHAVQLATPGSAVHHLDARRLAMLVSKLTTESATEVLAARGAGSAADALRAAHPLVGERLLRAMPKAVAAEIIAAMPAEYALRWRARFAAAPALLSRPFLRFRVWPRRRPRSS